MVEEEVLEAEVLEGEVLEDGVLLVPEAAEILRTLTVSAPLHGAVAAMFIPRER